MILHFRLNLNGGAFTVADFAFCLQSSDVVVQGDNAIMLMETSEREPGR